MTRLPDGTRPRPRQGLGERIIDGEALVVNAEGGEILVLNETGAFIWKLLDGDHDVSAIVSSVSEAFDVDDAAAREDVESFLGALAERGALA